MIVLDTECYKNYFLASFKRLDGGKVASVDMFNDSPLDTRKLQALLTKYTTISFNGNGYDLLMIVAAVQGFNNQQLKDLSDKIITTKTPSWQIVRDANLNAPSNWDHIDIMDVAPGQSGLKIYGGRLHAQKMQDLPIEPSALISEADRLALRTYCVNDLDTTELLYDTLKKQIELRETMSSLYGMDLRSKSDAQIAETVIKSELTKLTGKQYRAPKLSKDYSFRYVNPGVISFKNEQLKQIFARILETDFTLTDSGSVAMPEWLKKEKIMIGNARYQMGIGGLHSCENAQHVEAGNALLFDLDVASYYPSIILQQKLAPKTLGEPFLKVYELLVCRRLAAKHSGDKTTADTLKIVINGSFGKLGSKYSTLYAPDLLIQTTVTGQLALLMLIERIEAAGISVKSANTDGIVMLCPKDKEREMNLIAFDWMLDTSYELERTDYRSLSSRDVNNYTAIKLDGEAKGKGVFAAPGLQKNPDMLIVSKAVMAFLATGAPIEHTVLDCQDIRDFVTVRQVQGGAVYEGEKLGKAVRFYHSASVGTDTCIHYVKNGNRVPKSGGCRPAMDLSKADLSDVDRDYYICAAKTLLKEVGYA